ncbi:hypothetical protein APSETT444_002465 [Aspergillus pseudonomiae]
MDINTGILAALKGMGIANGTAGRGDQVLSDFADLVPFDEQVVAFEPSDILALMKENDPVSQEG